VREHQGQWDK